MMTTTAKAMKTSEISCAFENLRQDLECLLVELERPSVRSDYDEIYRIEREGQGILTKWVRNNFKPVSSGLYLITGKFGNAAQFGFYFQTFKFRIDPLRANQESYRWYVNFGKENEDSFSVLASLGFNS